MRKSLCVILATLLICSMFPSFEVKAQQKPMLSSSLDWNYGDKGTKLEGFIPALMEQAERPWELSRWTGIFRFADGKSSTISNYDVFSIKKKFTDDNYDKENGFGLVYKSKSALEELFNAIYAPYKNSLQKRQWDHLKEHFSSVANDPSFNKGNEYYYLVNDYKFLRTSGIVQKLGIAFDQANKVSESERQALFTRVPFPKLTVKNVGSKMVIDYEGSGFTFRDIRVVAVKKGGWFGKGEATITAIKTDTVGAYKPAKPVEMESNQIAYLLGCKKDDEVDFIIDDGYGQTVIVPAKLSGSDKVDDADFVPTDLTFTDGGQLWMKFRYVGQQVARDQLVNPEGMPMLAKVKIGGTLSKEFELPMMYKELPETFQPNGTYNVLLGKIDLGNNPGKYTIKVTGVVNNPSHPKRAIEAPEEAYKNNEIKGEWQREIKAVDHDLIAFSVTANPNSLKIGGKTNVTASVKNLGPSAQSNVRIRFYANGKQIHELKKDMPANKTIDVGGFSYEPTTTGVHSISVHIDPLQEALDKDRTNNIATTGCTVSVNGGGGNSGGGRCINQTNKTGNWTVTYHLITGYPTKTRTYTWTDAKGKVHTERESYTDYSDPIWETRNVPYSEKLTIDSKVNTKQGIPTDPKRPKDSDIESRGSWGIIPYAKEKYLDPNEVTRAGYGFELKVTTNYSSDWESKVPNGYENTAKPFGNQYKGAQTATARIYDSNNNYVTAVSLEKTSDNGKQATFELPFVSHKDSVTGKSFKYRKFFTDYKAPDGKYRIEIESGPAGATGISVCQDVFVWIYGSMYDDVQNLKTK
ncbi:CARDB domain-containing protein [Paenibacillus alvei]|uniref:CARDB domain-containing protein n=1 Tax=Paenibacillus alvei TaxID=44250 RepID=UPI00228239FC|nr:CARDB domain-containing protein [Paenibacillus alvei]